MNLPAATRLDALERWMQAALERPEGPEQVASEVLERVLPSTALSAVERLSIYSTMVRMRLVEVLAQDFPALRHALGDERWDALAAAYIERHPSSHYSLNELGLNLAGFVRDEATDGIVLAQRAFLTELAELERAIQEVFDAPASTSISAEALGEVPRESWPELRLETIPALQLFAFEHPVNAHYQAWREEKDPLVPAPSPSFVAVYRKDFVVWRANLDRERFALLEAFARGETLGRAVEQCASLPGLDVAALASSLSSWFQEWAAEGLFRAAHVG